MFGNMMKKRNPMDPTTGGMNIAGGASMGFAPSGAAPNPGLSGSGGFGGPINPMNRMGSIGPTNLPFNAPGSKLTPNLVGSLPPSGNSNNISVSSAAPVMRQPPTEKPHFDGLGPSNPVVFPPPAKAAYMKPDLGVYPLQGGGQQAQQPAGSVGKSNVNNAGMYAEDKYDQQYHKEQAGLGPSMEPMMRKKRGLIDHSAY